MRAALRFTWRLTKWAGIAVLLSYVAVCMGMYAMQRTLVFPKLADHVTAADAGFPEAQEVALQTSDGERLVAWYVPPKPDKPLFIYFHGNGDTLNWRVSRDRSLVADGSGLLAVSYRGYEGSTGSPSEDGMHLDAAAAYEFAIDHQIAPDRIVLWGHSLGTGVAVRLAAERKIKALVLEAPYTSVADVAAMNYPLLPVRWLLKDQFRSDLLIGKVTAPVLVFHGDKDGRSRSRSGGASTASSRRPNASSTSRLAATAISMTGRSSRAFATSSRGHGIAPPSQPARTAASAVA
jgi:acetyl esterase/lipase